MSCKYEVGQFVKVATDPVTIYIITKSSDRSPCHYDLNDVNDKAVPLSGIAEVQLRLINSEEIYDCLDIYPWGEETDKNSPYENLKWIFVRPTRDLEGLYDLSYTEKGIEKRETGSFYTRNFENRMIINIHGAEFILSFNKSFNEMTWRTDKKIRAFKKLNG